MSAVERIQAAIDKLKRLKEDSTPPTGGRSSWMQGDPKRNPYETTRDIFTGPEKRGESGDIATHLREEDAALIVTLHRTIDPQVRVLESAADFITKAHAEYPPEIWEKHPELDEALNGLLAMEIALADAILGAQS